MNPYIVLARRYRSQGFDEVVGQEHVAQTLQNAVRSGRVAHAYFFSGTRGVGKTSMARIFAKALCGGSEQVNAAIMAGQDTDVIEIDAASNNSVDNARELIASAGYRPLRGGRKVYIIDEAHMLSTAAFNALLKAMEEPPEHVVFILCTTEAQKIPATIASRCQRFAFRPIPASRIAKHLKDVLKKESIAAEEELLLAVGRSAAGSMRDALTLLDRLIAAGESPLTLSLLERLVGLPGRQLVGELVAAIAGGDPKAVLERADGLVGEGFSPEQIVESLIERLRDLMLLSACGSDTPLVELGEQARAGEAELASRFDAAGLTHMIALAEHMQRSLKSTSHPRAMLEALLVRLALSEHFALVAAIVGEAPGAAAPGGQTAQRPLAKKS